MELFLPKYNDLKFRRFVGAKYDIIILEYSYEHSKLFMKPNKPGEFYVETTCGGESSCGKMSSFSGANIYELEHRQSFELFINNNDGFLKVSTFDFDFLEEAEAVSLENLKYVELPQRRVLEQVYRNQNGVLIIVSNMEFHFSYENYKIHLFDPLTSNIIETKVANVERYRDGRTYYKTDLGTLFVPTSFSKDGIPTWKDATVKGIELPKENKYEIMLNTLNINREKLIKNK